jgi:hypothetical protein
VPTAPVPSSFPTGMQRGALNGQPAAAAVGERLERGIYHLLGARRLQFPGSSHPRTYANLGSAIIYTRVLRSAHTYGARLYLQYATVTPYTAFKLSISGGVTSPSIPLPPTPAGYSVDASREASLWFQLGTNVDSERATVDLTITIAFAWEDPTVGLVTTPDIRVYSWQIVPDDVQSVTGS